MFKIFNKTGAVMEHQIAKKIAKPAARKELADRISMESRNSGDKWWGQRLDSGTASKNLKDFQRSQDNTCPEKLSPEVEGTMWKEAKRLKDEFTVGMLSREELHPVKGFEFNGTMKWVVDEEKMKAIKSVEREGGWQKNNENKVKKYKNLMRHLDPDNPNAGDVEKFRPRRKASK